MIFKCYFCKSLWKVTRDAKILVWFGTKDIRTLICPDCYERLARDKRFRDFIILLIRFADMICII